MRHKAASSATPDALRIVLASVLLALAFSIPGAIWPGPAAAVSTAYYVDPVTGSDADTGVTPAAAWRTLGRATAAVLRPGDSIRLRADHTHVGALTIAEDGTADAPIRIERYDTGANPVVSDGSCITVTGDRVTVRQLKAIGCSYGGVTLRGAYDVVEQISARDNLTGVYVHEDASYAIVRRSWLSDNDTMLVRSGTDDDYGSHGVLVHGDHTEVHDNTIVGHAAPSPDYGVDGSAVEVFGAVGTRIHHNIARDNKAFVEIGGYAGRLAAQTDVTYNEVTGGMVEQHFLIARGGGSTWGPTLDTLVAHNTVRMTGEDSIGVGCYGGCGSDVLTVAGNVVDVNGGWSNADGPFVSHHNLYRGDWGEPPAATDLDADPGYVDAAAGDLRLRGGSLAVDAAGAGAAPWPTDLGGAATGVDGDGDGSCRVDIGAWERAGSSGC